MGKNFQITHKKSHVFCDDCIIQSLETRTSCPLCRAEIHNWGIYPDLLVSNLIDEIEVYCPYKTNGCQVKGPLGITSSFHINICEFKCLPEFIEAHQDMDYEKDIREYHMYGSINDKFAERIECDVNQVDLMTRIFNSNKELVTSALMDNSPSRKKKFQAKQKKPKKNNATKSKGFGDVFDDLTNLLEFDDEDDIYGFLGKRPSNKVSIKRSPGKSSVISKGSSKLVNSDNVSSLDLDFLD